MITDKEKIDEATYALNKHRHDVIVTCPATCWCWNVDNLLMIIEQPPAQPAPEGADRAALISVAALAFRAVEDGDANLTKSLRALDRYLANDVPESLWNEINQSVEQSKKEPRP